MSHTQTSTAIAVLTLGTVVRSGEGQEGQSQVYLSLTLIQVKLVRFIIMPTVIFILFNNVNEFSLIICLPEEEEREESPILHRQDLYCHNIFFWALM